MALPAGKVTEPERVCVARVFAPIIGDPHVNKDCANHTTVPHVEGTCFRGPASLVAWMEIAAESFRVH